MKQDSLHSIEYELALLVRLITAYSPKLGMLDRSEYLILSELDDAGSLGINAIADKLMLNISTASRQVGTLEAKNYIHRFQDPKNRRISLIQITEEGGEILHKVQKARYEVYKEILQDWSMEELMLLDTNLSRLNRDFKKRTT